MWQTDEIASNNSRSPYAMLVESDTISHYVGQNDRYIEEYYRKKSCTESILKLNETVAF